MHNKAVYNVNKNRKIKKNNLIIEKSDIIIKVMTK